MRLLELSGPQIIRELERMDKEIKQIREDAIKMSWYMRGGMSINDFLESPSSDRELINKLIKENLETTKKSGMPFF